MLVTHAEAGFVQSVVELTLGLLVDLSRGVSRAVADYHAGRMPEIKVGRQLGGSTVGIIGYGRISRALAPMLAALGMKVLVSDPMPRSTTGASSSCRWRSCWARPTTWSASPSPTRRPRT